MRRDGRAAKREAGMEVAVTGKPPPGRMTVGATMAYRRILIVEDEATLRRIIVRNLTGRGHQVREAATAGEAISAASAERPDLILLDINLPDKTGWDVWRALRERGIEVPTIIVSAVRVSQGRLAEFRPLAYLPKPFPLEALLRIVEGGCRAAVPDGDE